MRKNHLLGECKSRNCTVCNRRHHKLLYPNVQEDNKSNASQSMENKSNTKSIANCNHINDASKVLLSTAIIEIFDDRGGLHACRILLDSGFQRNIIFQELVNKLEINKRKSNVVLRVANNLETSCREWANVHIKSKTSNYEKRLDFLILSQITGDIPAYIVDKKEFNIPYHISEFMF